MSTITLDKSGALRVQTPYNPQLVSAIKMLPASNRKYDPTNKTWLVSAEHGQDIAAWIAQYCGELVMLPQATPAMQKETTDIFEVRYIGTTKERGGAERSAFGWVNGDWSIVFSETVLREWFDQPGTPGDESNLYAILSSKPDYTTDALKAAYRRLARQWHPDVCKEPDASQQFQKIQHAYEILSNAQQRAKYDAGLKLQALVKPDGSVSKIVDGYRSPLRCGLLACSGVWKMGRFAVTKILQWEDITNEHGQTLVVSWPMGADKFSEAWV